MTTVAATDIDSPTLAYSIVGGADAARFQINVATGALSFVAAPDFEKPSDHVTVAWLLNNAGQLASAQDIGHTPTGTQTPYGLQPFAGLRL